MHTYIKAFNIFGKSFSGLSGLPAPPRPAPGAGLDDANEQDGSGVPSYYCSQTF